MTNNSNYFLEDLPEAVAPANDGDGAYVAIIVFVVYALALKNA
jgi:hypothetical protein